jgi:glycosyltransferase involved in cell wall biosynthesis
MVAQSVPTERKRSSVAAIVPVFNRALKVIEALDGVRAQTLLPARLVVVDDGSTDGTADAVSRWIEATQPPFEAIVLRQSNLGVSEARNRGFMEASALEFVCFLDSDDVWPGDFLERSVRALEDDDRAVACASDQVFLHADGRANYIRDLSEIVGNPILWMYQNGAGVCSSTLIRTAAVRSVGRFDPAIRNGGEDFEFLVRLSLLGKWVHASGEPVSYYRGMGTDRVGEPHLSERLPNQRQAWVLHHEQLYRTLPARIRRGDRSHFARALASRWRAAGRDLERAGNIGEARRCYRKAIYWRPLEREGWGALFRSMQLGRSRR